MYTARFLSSAFSAGLVFLLALGAQAQSSIGNQHFATPVASPRIDTGVAMRFVAGKSRTATAVLVFVESIEGNGAGSSYRVGIAGELNGVPDEFIQSTVVIPSTLGWRRFDIPPTPLQAGTPYYVRIEMENSRSTAITVRELEPQLDLSPFDSSVTPRSVWRRTGSGWQHAAGRTPVFLIEGDAADPMAPATCPVEKAMEVEGNPYVTIGRGLRIGGQPNGQVAAQQFFVEDETWITGVEVLLREPARNPSDVYFEIRSLAPGQPVLESGKLSRGSEFGSDRWYTATLSAPLRLEGGVPPASPGYALVLSAPAASVPNDTDYRWVASSSRGGEAKEDDCSRQVRAGFGGSLATAWLYNNSSGLDQRHRLDAIFRLPTCDLLTWYEDGDGDGYGRNDSTVRACTQPSGYAAQGGDCNDTDPELNPGVRDVCDGVDNNCDGKIDDQDPEAGQGCDTGLLGVCANGVKSCVDGELTCTQKVFPTAEICDGADNDCDGEIDEDNPGGGGACETGEPGPCAVGTEVCQEGTLSCVSTWERTEEICDGIDNDCNGVVDDPEPTASYCDDGNPCTVDVCSEGTCKHPGGNDGAACDDGDSCTSEDACMAGVCIGTVPPGSMCGFDEDSPFTASPRELSADGSAVATLTARAQRTTGGLIGGEVTFTCTLGTLTPGELQPDGSWRAFLSSTEVGVSVCSAWAPDGKPFSTKVEITFVEKEVEALTLTASRSEALAGEPITMTAAFAIGAPADSVLRLTLPDGLEVVPQSALSAGTRLTLTQRPGLAEITLGEGASSIVFDVRAKPEVVPGPHALKARAMRGELPASSEAEAVVKIVEVYDLGGCGCASGGTGAGAFGLLALAALRRRRSPRS